MAYLHSVYAFITFLLFFIPVEIHGNRFVGDGTDSNSGCYCYSVSPYASESILENERQLDYNNFGTAWDKAEKWVEKKKPSIKNLTKKEMIAVHTYTLDEPKIHKDFNKQIKLGLDYENFKYKALFYYLHSAVKKISANSVEREIVYRGVSRSEEDAIPGKPFSFKSFTSTSLRKNNPFVVKAATVYYIKHTRNGAYIKELSAVPEEEEVLFLPCEKFMVDNVSDSDGKLYITLSPVSRSHTDTNDMCQTSPAAAFSYGASYKIIIMVLVALLV